MAQYPPPGLNYGHGDYRPQSTRPTSVTVMAILAIIFGALGLLCGGVTLMSQGMMLAMGGKNPILPSAPAMADHSILAYGAFAAFVRLLLSIALLSGGIGALGLKPWARRLLINWSVAVIIWVTINLALQLAWINGATRQYNVQFQSTFNAKGAQTLSYMAAPVQTAASIFVWLLGCVLPVLFLILWRSPEVIAAFEPNTTPPSYPYPPPQQF